MRASARWRRGFSLVELMAVLAVLALITGLVAWGVGRRPAAAAGPALWDALAAADARARARAEATGTPMTLRIDLNRQRLAWRGPGDAARAPASLRVAPPRGWRLTGFWVGGDAWTGRDAVELPVNVAGASPSFGLRLAASRGGGEAVVLVAGETGQWVPRPAAGLLPDEGGGDDALVTRR